MRSLVSMTDFNSFIRGNNLTDLGYSGTRFTWERRCKGDICYSKGEIRSSFGFLKLVAIFFECGGVSFGWIQFRPLDDNALSR